MKTKYLVFAAVAVMALLGAGAVGARFASDNEALFRNVLTVVNRRYIDKMSGDSLLKVAAQGLVGQLNDPYARLYSPEELTEFTSTALGHYGGVGMMLEERDGYAVVVQVYPNTPAEDAGLSEGVAVVAVNGDSTRGWPLEKTTTRLRGPIGSKVEIAFRRDFQHQPETVQLTRAQVRIPAVPYEIMIGSIGYIPITSFAETSAAEVEAAVGRLSKQGAKSYLLDIRGNGGGVLEQAVAIADIFLPGNLLVVAQREREERLDYRTDDDADLRPAPVVVLVDEGTASASEILAAALQDHRRGVVIGDSTFGKGVVQATFQVGNGHVLKLTTGEWLTPSGRSIHRRPNKSPRGAATAADSGGITPDILVRADTLSTTERALAEALRPHSRPFYLAYTELARELKDSVADPITINPLWRSELYRRMSARGVSVPRAIYDDAASYIDALLRYKIADYKWGDARARLVTLERDPQMRRALALLGEYRTDVALIDAVLKQTPTN